MLRNSLLLIICSISLGSLSIAQQSDLDVISYFLRINVTDSSDAIAVEEEVGLRLLTDASEVFLDLYQKDSLGFGMTIDPNFGVHQKLPTRREADLEGESKAHDDNQDFVKISYKHVGNRIYFSPHKDTGEITIRFRYQGIPKTGLIVGKNKFEERTFFGDNWPNRAHHWIACNDHPSDKAKVRFEVTAPEHYQCVATGLPSEFNPSSKSTVSVQGFKTHYYHSEIDLPTKVIVIGLANFYTEAVAYSFPLENWVYWQDSAKIGDLSPACEVLDFFVERIGPYPFEKLYNVQSTTQFGGMENAGNIFYDQDAFTGKNTMEALIAHEIAHQWFGNSASESDWEHLWLSEGFATYFTDLYWEHKFGRFAFMDRLKKERNRVVDFYSTSKTPVVDTTSDLMSLLNANSYQKGAWVLHMLRQKLGNDVFWQGIRAYYEQYQFANAETDDFFDIMEIASGMSLETFQQQWLHRAGHPVLSVTLISEKKEQFLQVKQLQDELFQFPLEILFKDKADFTDVKEFQISERTHQFKLTTKQKIAELQVDPFVKLLYQEGN